MNQGMRWPIRLLFVLQLLIQGPTHADPQSPSGNPAASETAPGTGALGRWLGLPNDGALRVSGVWVGNGSAQVSGGARSLAPTGGAQEVLVEASLDLGKAMNWADTWAWIQFLQVNADQSAASASGSVQGSNSLAAAPPLNRTEIFEYAIRKDLFRQQVRLIAGKQSASVTFANVNRPDGTNNPQYKVPSLSSLAFTPVYALPTLVGRLPGSTDSALGLSLTVQPEIFKKKVYISAGVFDGRSGLMQNAQPTGLTMPSLSGPLFSIVELGGGWTAGAQSKPGSFGIGAWSQGGWSSRCSSPHDRTSCFGELGAWGLYGLASQRLLNFRSGLDNSGLISFMSAGWSPAQTNLMTGSITAGLTAQGPMARRPKDSIGIGLSWAQINTKRFLDQTFNPSELMVQLYTQIHLGGTLFLQPTLTASPLVGDRAAAPGSLTGLLQLTALF
jgi:porin